MKASSSAFINSEIIKENKGYLSIFYLSETKYDLN